MRRLVTGLFLVSLLFASLLHFAASAGWMGPSLALRGGDILSAFPDFWAWKFNPKLIKENPSVVNWMGGEKTRFDFARCEKEYPLSLLPVCRGIMKLGKDGGAVVETENYSWNYGPVLHLIQFPLLFLNSFWTARAVWSVFLSILFWATLLLWYQMLFIDRGNHSTAIFVVYLSVWLNFLPGNEALFGTELEVFEMFLLSAGFFLLRKGRLALSGIAFGFAVLTKFLPALFFPYFLIRRQYRTFLVGCLTISILSLLTQVFLGWEWNYTLRLVGSIGRAFVTDGEGQSYPVWINRWFTHFTLFHTPADRLSYLPVSNPVLVTNLTNGFLAGLGLFFGYFFLTKSKSFVSDVEIGILLILMVSVIRWNHLYYLVFVNISFSIALRIIVERRCRGNKWAFWRGAAVVGFAFLTIGVFFPTVLINRIFRSYGLDFRSCYSMLSFPAYGYSILLIWLCANSREEMGIGSSKDPEPQPRSFVVPSFALGDGLKENSI